MPDLFHRSLLSGESMHGPGYTRDPTHTVVVRPSNREWVAERNGVELARSTQACELQEAGYPLVIYFPPEAVRLEVLSHSSTSTYCPFKGDASYLAMDGVDIAWRYATPYEEVSAIAGCIAFFPELVSVQERLAKP
jgi:uncharacterized protein (DUF427 family)